MLLDPALKIVVRKINVSEEIHLGFLTIGFLVYPNDKPMLGNGGEAMYRAIGKNV